MEGFRPASHVGPDESGEWPRPVTVVLHGNYDRPEWECDLWKNVAGFHGWVLCPRGVPTPWAEPSLDRWTYKGRAAVAREIEAALSALEERYPGRVSRDEMVLAGFSLGAILAPALAVDEPGRYDVLFLVEGGTKKLDRRWILSLKKAGVRGVGLAMSGAGRRNIARGAARRLDRLGLGAAFVDMSGAGHAYSDDFARAGRAAVEKLLETSREDPDAGGDR
ncbi:MAG: hypothetical protein R6V85_02505 [Polyangia bacterium]